MEVDVGSVTFSGCDMRAGLPALAHLPVFRFDNFSSLRHPHFGCVVADGKIFHRVTDLAAFYGTFGYTREVAATGIAADEYIWDVFTRAGAPQSVDCLQRLLVRYLHRHSVEFNDRYGDLAEELADACSVAAPCAHRFCADRCHHLDPQTSARPIASVPGNPWVYAYSTSVNPPNSFEYT